MYCVFEFVKIDPSKETVSGVNEQDAMSYSSRDRHNQQEKRERWKGEGFNEREGGSRHGFSRSGSRTRRNRANFGNNKLIREVIDRKNWD